MFFFKEFRNNIKRKKKTQKTKKTPHNSLMILFSFSGDNNWVPSSTTAMLKGSFNAPKRLRLHDVAHDEKEWELHQEWDSHSVSFSVRCHLVWRIISSLNMKFCHHRQHWMLCWIKTLSGEGMDRHKCVKPQKKNTSPCKKVQMLLKHHVNGAEDATDFPLTT